MKECIPKNKIEKYSNSERNDSLKGIQTIKKTNYRIVKGMSVMGDAPKSIIRLYEYDKHNDYRKRNVCRWPLYIAKTGHKWYPIESITEYLLFRLGEVFGLNMAKSSIVNIGGQIRFLSKYFLNGKDEELVHGADIFAGYLNDDNNFFVDEIERQSLSQELFTLQFIEKSVEYSFAFKKEEILHDLVKLLLFDAFVGNNDRHFYNWGVVRSMKQDFLPYFSPVYDTARGLFWNESEQKLNRMYEQGCVSSYMVKYCKKSKPKIGWEKIKNVTHFGLVEKIYRNEFYITKEEIKLLFLPGILERMKSVVNEDFRLLYSPIRREFINRCLDYRYQEINKIIV